MQPHQRIARVREDSGLTREDLAQRLNLSYWAVAKYETGERTPPQNVLMAMADVLGVSTDYLLGRTDDPRPPRATRNSDERQAIVEAWLTKLPPDMQQFLLEESQHGFPFLRLARGLKMQDLNEEEVRVIIETWMDAKKRRERESGPRT